MFKNILTTSAGVIALGLANFLPTLALAAGSGCVDQNWIDMTDTEFARNCAGMAFSDSLENRETMAWMLFTRVNQLIADDHNGGMSETNLVPVWMSWATDPDTFATRKRFKFKAVRRASIMPVSEKRELHAGTVSTIDPDGSNEEAMRNPISYDYLVDSGLTTKRDVAEFFKNNDYVDMPIGSIELKGAWLQITDDSPAPDGALTFQFSSGHYWLRGLHIMAKMRHLDDPKRMFYTEESSWFWTTFEFNRSPGVEQVRKNLITQRSPLDDRLIDDILRIANLDGFGFEQYAPNGTQIRFTVDGLGTTPVVLGHTAMEDFAGAPNTAQSQYWTSFEASCHSCHATASYNPDTATFFPLSVPKGALDPSYNHEDKSGTTQYLGQGFKPLDFMWPITFQAK